MSHNTWLHRFSRQLVIPLVNTPVTPNHLTTARLVTGTAAAACFVPGEMHWNIMGGILFLVSMILDRADGVLARMKNCSSTAGAIYDIVADAVCTILTFLALGVAVMDSYTGNWSIIIAVIAGLSVSLIFIQIIIMELYVTQGGGKFDSIAGFDVDDTVIVIPFAIILGYGEQLLLLAGICAPIALLIVSFKLHRRRQQI